MTDISKDSLREFLQEKTSSCKVLVIGDIMLDKYLYGEVTRISAEAPVPITRVNSSTEKLGGAANIAYNLAVLGCKVSIAGFVGADVHCNSLIKKLHDYDIDAAGLIKTTRPTTTKVRVISGNQQMFRLDFEETRKIEDNFAEKLQDYVAVRLNESLDCIIICDHDNGACTEKTVAKIIELGHNHGVPIIVDMSCNNWINYKHADCVVANMKRINKQLLQPIENEDILVEKAGHYLLRKFHIKGVVATRSELGLSLIGNDRTVHISTKAQELFDVLGATDAVTAVMAMALAGGLKSEAGAYLANLAASRVVTKLGTYAVTIEELKTLLDSDDSLGLRYN